MAAGLPVRCGLIDDNGYNRKYKMPGPLEVRFVTIHNTAEPFSAWQERERVNNRRDRVSVSFHYAVDESEAVQLLPPDKHGWHAGDGRGDGNMRSIGIEICRSQCYGTDDKLYRQAEANAVILAAWLLKTNQLPLAALKKHQDWSGKYCPHRILDEGRWEEFKGKVAAAMPGAAIRNISGIPQQEAEAIIIAFGKDATTIYKSFTGKEYTALAAMVADLCVRGIKAVDLSSWVSGLDAASIREAFQDAGIKIRMFYGLKPGAPEWQRENYIL